MALSHSELLKQVLLKCSSRRCRLWRVETGVARSLDGKRIIRYGLNGCADITGILKCNSGIGARIEIEIKIGKDFQSNDQENFNLMISEMGGLYILCRNLDETLDIINDFADSN